MIRIMPYTKLDGIPTFKDSVIMGIYDRIIKEGKEYVFQDGTIPDREVFLLTMKSPQTFLYVGYEDNELALIIWLNRFEGAMARLNWCAFDGVSLRDKIKIAKNLLESLTLSFDLLIGYTPASNKAAIKFVKVCGGKVVGTVPDLIWNEEKQESEAGVISYFRGEHESL